MRRAVKHTLYALLPERLYWKVATRVAAYNIRTRRRWEPDIDRLPEFIAKGDMVLDLGANHGLYCYHLSRLARHVHAFEPLPPNLTVLRGVLDRLSIHNVTVHPVGVGEERKTVSFTLPTDDGVPLPGIARLSSEGDDGLHYVSAIERLDDVIHDPVRFIKCDVEGAELFAFRGAVRILTTDRPVILCEISIHEFSRYGITSNDIRAFFRSVGYRIERDDQPDLCGNYFLFPVSWS